MTRSITTWIGIILVAIVVIGAAFAPQLAPFDPNDQNIIDRLTPPGGDYLLGTDTYGRDVLSRILWGGRISLIVAMASITAAILVGGSIGIVSGYIGGRTDLFIMQVMDVMRVHALQFSAFLEEANQKARGIAFYKYILEFVCF